MQITLDQAMALCSVVDCGGYTKASEKLNKSHSSLIYSVRNLEEQCGFSLFNRSAYKNKLTDQGKVIYHKCRELVAKAEEIKSICTQLNSGWEPQIKIVFDGILPVGPLLSVYKKVKSEQIPTQIQTYANYLHDVEVVFEEMKAEMMISILPAKNTKLEAIFLKPLSIYLVAHREHPLSKARKKWSLPELLDFSFLTVRSSQRDLNLNTEELEKSASFYLSDFSFKKEAIMSKFGFGWLPEHLIQQELKSKKLIPLNWERKSKLDLQPILYIRNGHQLGKTGQILKESLQLI